MEQVVVRRKQKGKRKEDLSRLPKRIEKHELTKEQLKEIFGENGWKRLPDELYSRVEYQPAVREVVEHHVAVYAAKKTDVDTIVRADQPVDLLRNSIATPSLVAAIMNAKYTNAIPLYRIAQDFEQNDMILSRATMANWVIRCAERYLSLVYDRLRTELCSRHVLQVDETTCQVTKDGRSSDTKSYMFVYRTSEHCPERPVILYQYAMTRSRSNVQRFLKGFSGILESDAFSGYKALDKEKPEIQAAFCWAHARRDYADALKALKYEDKEYACPQSTGADCGDLQGRGCTEGQIGSRQISWPPEGCKTSCGGLLRMGSGAGACHDPERKDKGWSEIQPEPGKIPEGVSGQR